MTLKTATLLAFERKLNNSDALFYSGRWDDRDAHDGWPGVQVREKAVRGTISNRLKSAVASDPTKVDAEIRKPNLQTVDAAALPTGADTLKVRFTLRVIGGLSHPSACNDVDYQAALRSTIDEYLENHGCREQAYRYACNLATGRFLWRNRIGAESVEVRIESSDGFEGTFDAYARSLDDMTSEDPEIRAVADTIAKGLGGQGFSLLTVTAFVKLGEAQEVFPSQELVQDRQDGKSKHLYTVADVAAMHSQKIGNAIRTIDTWHPAADDVGAIAVEPYGSVTSRGKAYRQPVEKLDFYTLLDNWIVKGKSPETEQQHYVVATLIRGGVFGAAS